jgi:O-antigen/teichoic acid export membrane protein
MTSLRIDSRLRADFSWVLSGNVIYSACQWGIVLLLAKLGDAGQVGLYALGMAVSAPIILFANLQVRTLLASDVKEEFRFGQYLAFRFVSLFLALLAIAAVAIWTTPDWLRRTVIILVGFAQILEYVSETYYGLMQKYDRMDRMSRSLMVKGPLALTALCVTMFYTHNIVWAIVALILGRLLVVLLWDSRLTYIKNFSAPLEWNSPAMMRLLRLSLPLGIISMLASLSANIPRYFIEGRLGTTDLGIYSAIASLLTAGTLVVSAFGQSIMVPAARASANGDRIKYRSLVMQTVVLGLVLGLSAVLCAALFGQWLLSHLFRPEYAEHPDIFVWLMAAGTILFMTSGLGFVMTAARALKPQIPLLLANCLTAALASAWLVPRHGLRGAAEAILISTIVQLVGSIIVLRGIDRRMRMASSRVELQSVGAQTHIGGLESA